MADDQGWQAPGEKPRTPPRYGEYAPPGQHAGTGAPGFSGAEQPGAPYGSAPGWTPPPKPGLIPLRPLGFGTLIGAPFQELRRNARAVVGSALLIQGILLVVSVVVVGVVSAIALTRISMADASDLDAITSGSVASIIVSALVPVALSLVGSAFLTGIIVSDVARGTLGEKLSLKELWRLAGRRLWPLTAWVLIVAGVLLGLIAVVGGAATALILVGNAVTLALGIVVAILGALALVALGVWLYTKTSLVPCLIVMERLGVRASIRRSWSLTRGYFWRTFGVQFLVAAIVNIVAQVVTTPVALVYGFLVSLIDPTGSGQLNGGAITAAIVSYAVLLLVSLVIGAVTTVVQSSAIALIYIDLRMRKEGLDLKLVRFVEARQTGRTDVVDPYLVETAAAEAPGTPGTQPPAEGSPWA